MLGPIRWVWGPFCAVKLDRIFAAEGLLARVGPDVDLTILRPRESPVATLELCKKASIWLRGETSKDKKQTNFKALLQTFSITEHQLFVASPLFLALRRSSHFCEIVVNFYAVLSKRGRFTKAPSLKTSWFPCRGPRVSTIRFLFQLQYFDFLFGEVKQPI